MVYLCDALALLTITITLPHIGKSAKSVALVPVSIRNVRPARDINGNGISEINFVRLGKDQFAWLVFYKKGVASVLPS